MILVGCLWGVELFFLVCRLKGLATTPGEVNIVSDSFLEDTPRVLCSETVTLVLAVETQLNFMVVVLAGRSVGTSLIGSGAVQQIFEHRRPNMRLSSSNFE